MKQVEIAVEYTGLQRFVTFGCFAGIAGLMTWLALHLRTDHIPEFVSTTVLVGYWTMAAVGTIVSVIAVWGGISKRQSVRVAKAGKTG